MSRASKVTLALTGLGTAGIVFFVHWGQEKERAVCFYFILFLSPNFPKTLLVFVM